jgi:type II secretory pathway pseudopilin PulG
MNASLSTRRNGRLGITLLEVLISIGILSIGLASVISLIPAAGLQASRAIVLDRASGLAANVLADAATFGMLSPECVQNHGTYTFLDPAATGNYLSNAQRGQLKDTGVFSPADNTSTAGPSAERLVLQSRDDIAVAAPQSDDDPPRNLFDAVRSFQGRYTALLGLSGTTPGMPATMSVVVFYRRDTQNALAIDAQINGLRIDAVSLDAAQRGDRRFRDIMRPGMVIWDGAAQRFHHAASVAVDRTDAFAYVTFTDGALLTGPIQILPDSVGLASRMYVPEYGSQYRR